MPSKEKASDRARTRDELLAAAAQRLSEAEEKGRAEGRRFERDPHLLARASIDDLRLQFVSFGDINAIYTPSRWEGGEALVLVRQVSDPLDQDRLLAHVAAHHVLGHDFQICFPDPTVFEGSKEYRQLEREADQFAGAFLGAADRVAQAEPRS